MRLTRLPIEAVTLLYLLAYLPYILITRMLATRPAGGLGRPMTGLETLPAVLIMGSVMLALFVWLSGWWRSAHQVRIGRLSLPVPARWTALSGVGTSLLLFTVPLSLTFEGVSIPFIQLLMRGDILVIAPLVDLAAGRRVRWYSWVALAMVTISPLAGQGAELRWGFVDVWSSSAMPMLSVLAVAFFAVSILSAVILLNPRENSFCVPFERAASILAGSLAAFILALIYGQDMPTPTEIVGIVLLIGAIALLSFAPHWERARRSQPDAG